METITANLSLDTFQVNALAEESRKRQISLDELISHLVKRYLDELTPATKTEQPDFMAFVGLGSSGLTDVSENHDRYLGEAIAHEHLR